jgi:hypothetical protein
MAIDGEQGWTNMWPKLIIFVVISIFYGDDVAADIVFLRLRNKFVAIFHRFSYQV